MVISEPGGTSGYGNSLPTVLSVFCSPEKWVDTGANIHICADASLFSSYQVLTVLKSEIKPSTPSSFHNFQTPKVVIRLISNHFHEFW